MFPHGAPIRKDLFVSDAMIDAKEGDDGETKEERKDGSGSRNVIVNPIPLPFPSLLQRKRTGEGQRPARRRGAR